MKKAFNWREVREFLNLSCGELGSRVGFSRNGLSSFELGKKTLGKKRQIKLLNEYIRQIDEEIERSNNLIKYTESQISQAQAYKEAVQSKLQELM